MTRKKRKTIISIVILLLVLFSIVFAIFVSQKVSKNDNTFDTNSKASEPIKPSKPNSQIIIQQIETTSQNYRTLKDAQNQMSESFKNIIKKLR